MCLHLFPVQTVSKSLNQGGEVLLACWLITALFHDACKYVDKLLPNTCHQASYVFKSLVKQYIPWWQLHITLLIEAPFCKHASQTKQYIYIRDINIQTDTVRIFVQFETNTCMRTSAFNRTAGAFSGLLKL